MKKMKKKKDYKESFFLRLLTVIVPEGAKG